MIYFLRSGDFGNIKIGYTKNHETLKTRLDTLQIGASELLQIIGITEGSQKDERLLHKKFYAYQLHGEWFQSSPTLINFINELCNTNHETGYYGSLKDLSRASLSKIISNMEKKYIKDALKYANGNKVKASRVLGITYRVLCAKVIKLKINDIEDST